jgi:hypothetical protein
MSSVEVIFSIPLMRTQNEVREPISSSNIEEAREIGCRLAAEFGVSPVSFVFAIDITGSDQKPKEGYSRRYFLGGDVRTIKDVQRDKKPTERILLDRMRREGFDRVLTIKGAVTMNFLIGKDDIVLEPLPTLSARGPSII